MYWHPFGQSTGEQVIPGWWFILTGDQIQQGLRKVKIEIKEKIFIRQRCCAQKLTLMETRGQ